MAHCNSNGKIRVVHIVTVQDSLLFLQGQIAYIREHGFDVQVVCSPGRALDAFSQEFSVPCHAVAMQREISPKDDLKALWHLIKVIRSVKPQIVHAGTPKASLLGMIAAAVAGIPVRIYQMRGLRYITTSGAKRALLRGLEILTGTLAHRIICNSHSLREFVVKERLCAAKKITVLAGGSGNGVDAENRFNPVNYTDEKRRALRARWKLPEEAVVIGFVGRLVRDKGIMELAAAWRQLRGEYPHCHLLCVGDYEDGDPVPSELRRFLEQDDRVHCIGWLNDPRDAYAAMDFLVLPSYREGFANVLLEASAMAIPLVTTNVPGCKDAVDEGTSGLLVAPRDVEGLYKAIRRYLVDPALRISHGRSARAKVLIEFQQEVVWQALVEEYQQLVAECKN